MSNKMANVLNDIADEVKRLTPPWEVTADIATDESEQEYGVVLNQVFADHFGFNYNQYQLSQQ